MPPRPPPQRVSPKAFLEGGGVSVLACHIFKLELRSVGCGIEVASCPGGRSVGHRPRSDTWHHCIVVNKPREVHVCSNSSLGILPSVLCVSAHQTGNDWMSVYPYSLTQVLLLATQSNLET